MLGPLKDRRLKIIESVQPYKVDGLTPDDLAISVNRNLGILHEWARIDRHRRLHVLGSWMAACDPQIYCTDATLVSMKVIPHNVLTEENEIAIFRLEGYKRGMIVLANPYAAIQITLNEAPTPCTVYDTLEHRLREMLNAVSYVVIAMADSF